MFLLNNFHLWYLLCIGWCVQCLKPIEYSRHIPRKIYTMSILYCALLWWGSRLFTHIIWDYLTCTLSHYYPYSSEAPRCDMAFIEPMHRNKPNIIYLTKHQNKNTSTTKRCAHFMAYALYISGHAGGLCIYCTLSRESAVGDLCWGNCIALFKFVWMSTISFIGKGYWQNENGITFLGNTAKHADAVNLDINSLTQPFPPPLSLIQPLCRAYIHLW